jgi:hypothetical protein
MVNTTSNLAGAYKPIIPFGFYTAFDDYLANDPVTIVGDAKKSGYVISPLFYRMIELIELRRNMIHIVPPFLDDMTAFQSVLNEMAKQEMYLMYDIRE